MSLKCGIVGLPNVGKSTLFNALTNAKAESANYPFCTIDPNVGIVTVPDERLSQISKLIPPEKLIPTTIEFVDIAGLVKGASKGEGLGNQFLANIRETDAIAHVVRCFDDDNVVHVEGSIDPLRDIETINTELLLADLESMEKRVQRLEKTVKGSKDPKLKMELDLSKEILGLLQDGKPARTALPEDPDHLKIFHMLQLLTSKPVLYVCNVSEDEYTSESSENFKRVQEFAKAENNQALMICSQMEAEIIELDAEEREEFLKDMGVEEP
ncbi:MAG: redox-regulated ATPase YchF, partial [Bdellovibrionaceae bacterium]|nr:redox-regulated ATPase YchF [Pseudobdellovibrionaceae bacterium]